MKDCVVREVSFKNDKSTENRFKAGSSFILPGGICEGSSPADVYSVFGDPNDNDAFKKCSIGIDQTYGNVTFNYSNYDNGGYSYSFGFNKEGKLYGCTVESPVNNK